MSRIQNEDIKSLAQLQGAGGQKSQLPNSSKVYLESFSEAKTFKEAVDERLFHGNPVQIYPSLTPDAKLNILPSSINTIEGIAKSVSPIKSQIPTVVASTIDFQTNATTGNTFSITWPTSTVGQFRRLGLSLLSNGTIQGIFSAEAASVGALANPGTLFVKGALPLGFIDLECTNTSGKFKTAGSATNIIEAKVSGTARIFIFGAGSGSGSSGNANSFLIELQDRLGSSYFNMFTPNIFENDESTKVDNASTGTYDVANSVYSLPTIGNKLVSTQMYDPTFLANTSDSIQTELDLQWGTIDPIALYEISRDGGLNWTTMTMSRVGVSSKVRGIAMFPAPSTVSSLVTYDSTNADSQRALNATGVQQLAVSFTVGSGVKWRTSLLRAFVNKLGSPVGFVWAQLVKDNAGSPSTLSSDIVCETSQVNIANLSAGNNNLDFSITQPLPAGTYWMLLKTDLAYKNSYSAGVTELRWRSDNSSPSYAGTFKSFDGTTWSAALSDDATFLIQGIPYDLRVRVTSATTAVSIYGYGIFYEEDSMSLPADNEEYQSFDVDGNLDTTSFSVTNFNVNPRLLKIYDVDNDSVFRFPKFAVMGNTVSFPAGTFLAPGKKFKLIFEQSPSKTGYNTDKLSNALANNGLGSTDGNFDFSSPGVGLKLRSADGTKWHVRVTNTGAIETIINGW